MEGGAVKDSGITEECNGIDARNELVSSHVTLILLWRPRVGYELRGSLVDPAFGWSLPAALLLDSA